MDTSIQYIKMSEKAFGKEEPRGGWVKYSFRTIITEHGYWYDGNEKEGYIPLKTQIQLQKMVLNKDLPNPIAGLIWDFSSFADPSEDIHKICVSMEQLWLAFVMKKLYNKIWNREDWIVEK